MRKYIINLEIDYIDFNMIVLKYGYAYKCK